MSVYEESSELLGEKVMSPEEVATAIKIKPSTLAKWPEGNRNRAGESPSAGAYRQWAF